MRLYEEDLSYKTRGYHKERDITEDIADVVKKSRIKNGRVLLFIPHTTCVLILNENEIGFLSDLKVRMDSLVPKNAQYLHDNPDVRLDMPDGERVNGYAHLQVEIFGTRNLTLPIRDSKIRLGEWQKIFLMECDGARERFVYIQVYGD